jgi:ABC-type nickel/cobalt efflux system permease component RcnA
LFKAGGERFPMLGYIGPILIIFLGSYLLKRSLKETRHKNEEECNDPMHFHFNDTKYASPFIAGLVAGSIPCPSAIAVLLIASNKFQEDIITLYSSIFIYVLGIALTLISIMTLFLLFKDRFVNQLNTINKTFNTNVIAAILIILVGVLYFLLSFFGIQHQH